MVWNEVGIAGLSEQGGNSPNQILADQLILPMENIGGGMAALSKSADGPIWLGRQLE